MSATRNVCQSQHSDLLLAMLVGSDFACAMRRNGKPGRIVLPPDAAERQRLIEAHLAGSPATLTFVAEGYGLWNERVSAVMLCAYCPASDGLCRWMVIDLDAADHGAKGLADPVHAARCVAERAEAARLFDGILVATSRRGRGRHVFVIPPAPMSLADGVIAIAALAAMAFNVAARDAVDGDVPHAFVTAGGTIAQPGDAGAFELVPRSIERPKFGWSMALPSAAAYARCDGGVIVDPFDDKSKTPDALPRCDADAWATLLREARQALALTKRVEARAAHRPRFQTRLSGLDRIDARTRNFIDGRAAEGTRNQSAFAASANLLGCGFSAAEAERLILDGAEGCGLPAGEARAAFKSALKVIRWRSY